MARQPRMDLAGLPQHIVQRGNNRQPCFQVPDDYLKYLASLRESCLRYNVALHAYCLMTNHVHLLATPENQGGISRMMQHLGRLFVSYINTTYRRTGTLWEGRFKSCLVDSDSYALACHRYIELNPVRAEMVATPEDYEWSSHRSNALGLEDPLLTPHSTYTALSAKPKQRQCQYRALFDGVLTGRQIEEIRTYLQQQRALGSEEFQQAVAVRLARCATTRPAHRPAGKTLKSGDKAL